MESVKWNKVMKEDMCKPFTFKKKLWQWSSEGRDFCEIPSDKDMQNMRIKILLNLEQCTEDHDNERIDKLVIADNRDLYDSETEETEYKILLDNISKNTCMKNTMASSYCEKKDDEKEENESKAEEKDGWICEEMEKDEEKSDLTDIVNYDNEKMEKFEAKCLKKKQERQLESDDGLPNLQYARCHSKENCLDLNEDKIDEGKKKHLALMLGEGRNGAEAGDQLNKVVAESGIYEDLDSFGPENTNEVETKKNDLIQKCSVVLGAEDPGFCSEFENLTDDGNGKVRSSERRARINSNQSISEVGNLVVNEADLCELFELSENWEDESREVEENNARNPVVTDVADENGKHQFRSSVYSGEDLIVLKSEFLSFTFPVVCCSDTDWYEKQERTWKNISSFSMADKDPEIQNCVRCCGGNGSNKGSTSTSVGNGENSNSTSGHQSGCASLMGCSSNFSGGGGCAGGGGGGDDGDKWKKENFCHSDVISERKTKQMKEIKKKSRLEKADLTGSQNSDPVVCYASEEDLREMSAKWEERAKNLRKNVSARRLAEPCQNEGIVLNQYKAQFLITGNSYSEDQEWFIVTDESLGTGHGSSSAAHYLKRGASGKCYPCADINTETKFCVKKISLYDFYASEIIILMELDHPGVVKLYGAIFTEDAVVIMMELITGPTLQEYITQESKLDCPIALHYTKELLEVLAYLHKEGIIHDDIKADNIMLRNGSTVVIDFGLAKRKPSVEVGAFPCGSQCGLSPEKATSSGYDTRADVWAAIAVLVHMISGSMPWRRRFKQKGALHLIIAKLSPPLDDVPADVLPEVRSLIESGWTVDAKKRPFAHDILSHAAFQYSCEHCQDNSDNNGMDTEDLIAPLREGEMLLERAELSLASSERNVIN